MTAPYESIDNLIWKCEAVNFNVLFGIFLLIGKMAESTFRERARKIYPLQSNPDGWHWPEAVLGRSVHYSPILMSGIDQRQRHSLGPHTVGVASSCTLWTYYVWNTWLLISASCTKAVPCPNLPSRNYFYNLNTNLAEKGKDWISLLQDMILFVLPNSVYFFQSVYQHKTRLNAKLWRRLTIPSKSIYCLPFHIPSSPRWLLISLVFYLMFSS